FVSPRGLCALGERWEMLTTAGDDWGCRMDALFSESTENRTPNPLTTGTRYAILPLSNELSTFQELLVLSVLFDTQNPTVVLSERCTLTIEMWKAELELVKHPPAWESERTAR